MDAAARCYLNFADIHAAHSVCSCWFSVAISNGDVFLGLGLKPSSLLSMRSTRGDAREFWWHLLLVPWQVSCFLGCL